MADTAKIKQKLNKFRRKALECKSMKEEVRYIEDSYGNIKSTAIGDMPRGRTSATSSQEIKVMRKIGLEEQIVKKEAELNTEWNREIEPLVERIEPINAFVIRLRYFYGEEWAEISRRLYGKKEMYESEQKSYLNKLFKQHGRALLELAKVFSEKSS